HPWKMAALTADAIPGDRERALGAGLKGYITKPFNVPFFFSSRRRHTRSVSAFLLNRSSDLPCVYAQETLTFLLTQKKTCVKNYVQKRSEERRVGKECRYWVEEAGKIKKRWTQLMGQVGYRADMARE